MITHSLSLFPTLVHVIDKFLTFDQCMDIVSFLRNEKYEMVEHKAFDGEAITSYTTSHSTMKLDDIVKHVQSCVTLKEDIQQAIDNYSREAGFPSNRITNLWANFQSKESTLKEHVHGMSYVSGALFLQTDEQSSKLFVHNPNPHVEGIDNKNSEKQYVWDWFCINPTIGKLVLFPSWLKHGSNYNQNNSEERVVLSFNTI